MGWFRFLGSLVQPTAPSSDTASSAAPRARTPSAARQHGLAEAADDQRRGVLRIDAALLAIEQALLGDARGGGLVLDHGVAARGVDGGKVCAAVRARSAASRIACGCARPGGVGLMRTRPR